MTGTESVHEVDLNVMSTQVTDASEPRPLGERLAAAPLNLAITAVAAGLHALALAALLYPFEARFAALMVFVYLWIGLAVTLYMHRCLAHKGLVLAAPLRVFFALGAAVGLAGDPLFWVGMHRRHHAATDVAGDPHTPRLGAFQAHIGWALRLNPSYRDELRALTADVRQERVCRWLEPTLPYLATHAAFAAVVYLAFGPAGLLWGLYVPLVVNMHAIYAVNSICHLPRFGYRSRETRDDSRNVGWLALLTLGESYHNHHHADPRRARHGLSWREPDVTAAVIWLLERLGLARQVAW